MVSPHKTQLRVRLSRSRIVSVIIISIIGREGEYLGVQAVGDTKACFLAGEDLSRDPGFKNKRISEPKIHAVESSINFYPAKKLTVLHIWLKQPRFSSSIVDF